MLDAMIKVITAWWDPNILTVEMPFHEQKPHEIDRALIISTELQAFYFHKGDKQDGKLWSVVRFNPNHVKIITDLNIPERMKEKLDKNEL
jgi:hypothetical protein